MAQVVVAEVLDKTGRVITRERLTEFAAGLGRAYDNAVILDDPFVSPHHAKIERDEDGIFWLEDLGSENGVYVLPEAVAVTRLPLAPDTLVRLGHTLVRLRTPAYRPAPTRRDTLGMTRASRWLTTSLGAAATTLLAVALAFVDAYQTSEQHADAGALLLVVLPGLAGLIVWAGLWALVSRSFAHHLSFAAHLAIAGLALVAYLVLDTTVAWGAFAFNAPELFDTVYELGLAGIGGSLLYASLRFATLLTPRAVLASSVVTVGAMLALFHLAGYVQGLEFNEDLPYAGELEPPLLRFAPAVTPSAFAEGAKAMVRELEGGDYD